MLPSSRRIVTVRQSRPRFALPGTIFGVPEVVPGINVKETISTVKFGVNYRFGPY